MIAWRTLACFAAVLCLVAAGCGDDGELTSGFAGPASGGSDSDPGATSPVTGSSSGSSGGGLTSTGSQDPTTGSNSSVTTTNGPTSTGTTTWGSTTDDTSGTTTTTTTDGTGSSTGNITNPTTMTNPGGCGNGEVDPNEQCDGANLNGFTCESLGNAGGTLGCDPVTCTFDTSMCMGNGSGGTSG